MSFLSSISSIVPSVLPSVAQTMLGGVASSSPYGLLFGALLGNNPGSAGGTMPGLQMFTPFLKGLLGRFRLFGGRSMEQATPKGQDDSQAKIDSILNGNYSLEEKIILIAGVVTDSISEQLDEKLKEQGKLAKKAGSGDASAAASGQNVENKIQVLMQRLNRMQSLASNMIQAQHSTKKSQIMNIRV